MVAGIGELNWYGGFNRRKNIKNNFGFFCDLKTREDIYFSKVNLASEDLAEKL